MVTCSLQANPPDLTSDSTYDAASDSTSDSISDSPADPASVESTGSPDTSLVALLPGFHNLWSCDGATTHLQSLFESAFQITELLLYCSLLSTDLFYHLRLLGLGSDTDTLPLIATY